MKEYKNRWDKPLVNKGVTLPEYELQKRQAKTNSPEYFAKLAREYHGLAVRDNSFAELVQIGQGIELSQE